MLMKAAPRRMSGPHLNKRRHPMDMSTMTGGMVIMGIYHLAIFIFALLG